MQQDIDRAQGRGGDAFEEIASSSPLPVSAPQQTPNEIIGLDIEVPGTQPTPPAAPVFTPAPMPSPAPAPMPVAIPQPAVEVPAVAPVSQPVVPMPAPAPQLSDEELDALLPLDTPSAPAPSAAPSMGVSAPSTTAFQPSPAPQPTEGDFGSVARRVPSTSSTPPAPLTDAAPQPLPMNDIAPAAAAATPNIQTAPLPETSRIGGGTPPTNLPIGEGPRLTPSTPGAMSPPVFEPAPMPRPAPQPIPPFGQPAPQGLEEGEDLPAQTPEELLGLGMDEPSPQPSFGAPEMSLPSSAPAAAPAPAPAPEEPMFVEEKGSPLSSRALIIVAGGLVATALAATLAYFFFFAPSSQQTPVPEEPVTPSAEEAPLVPPSPLITPDGVEEIVLSQLSTQSLQTALSRISSEDLQPGSITYLPIRLSEATSDGRPQYLTAQLFFTTLGVALPDSFLTTIEPTFMLYAYGPGEEEELVCASEGASTSATCPGPRLGVILQARAGQEANTAALVAAWTALDMSTLKPLVLDEATLPTATPFKQGTYTSAQTATTGTIPLYYANLPHSATALNFAVAPEGAIVIGTSKNSLYAALDSLLEE